MHEWHLIWIFNAFLVHLLRFLNSLYRSNIIFLFNKIAKPRSKITRSSFPNLVFLLSFHLLYLFYYCRHFDKYIAQFRILYFVPVKNPIKNKQTKIYITLTQQSHPIKFLKCHATQKLQTEIHYRRQNDQVCLRHTRSPVIRTRPCNNVRRCHHFRNSAVPFPWTMMQHQFSTGFDNRIHIARSDYSHIRRLAGVPRIIAKLCTLRRMCELT